MSENSEVHNNAGISPKTKLIHFSDGSTMEVEDEDKTDRPIHSASVHQHQSVDSSSIPVDPTKLHWPEWIKHYSAKGSSSVVNGLEYTGESLAYYLGITSPKYQHEIDEYNRMVTKKAAHDQEVKSWSSTNPSTVPIVMEQITTDKGSPSSTQKNDDEEHTKV